MDYQIIKNIKVNNKIIHVQELFIWLLGRKKNPLNKCVPVRGVDSVFFFSNNNPELIGSSLSGLRVNAPIFFTLL